MIYFLFKYNNNNPHIDRPVDFDLTNRLKITFNPGFQSKTINTILGSCHHNLIGNKVCTAYHIIYFLSWMNIMLSHTIFYWILYEFILLTDVQKNTKIYFIKHTYRHVWIGLWLTNRVCHLQGISNLTFWSFHIPVSLKIVNNILCVQ